jgi:hypothetical protein
MRDLLQLPVQSDSSTLNLRSRIEGNFAVVPTDIAKAKDIGGTAYSSFWSHEDLLQTRYFKGRHSADLYMCRKNP